MRINTQGESPTLTTSRSVFLVKPCHEESQLLVERAPTMILAPHVLCQIQGQPFAADAPFGSQPAFQIPPAAFQAIDVRPVPTPTLAVVMVDQAMDTAIGGNPGVEPQGIGADDRAYGLLRPDETTDSRYPLGKA